MIDVSGCPPIPEAMAGTIAYLVTSTNCRIWIT